MTIGRFLTNHSCSATPYFLQLYGQGPVDVDNNDQRLLVNDHPNQRQMSDKGDLLRSIRHVRFILIDSNCCYENRATPKSTEFWLQNMVNRHVIASYCTIILIVSALIRLSMRDGADIISILHALDALSSSCWMNIPPAKWQTPRIILFSFFKQ